MSSEQTSKFIHNFKKGDIVHFHGARFECIEDAHESSGHRPMAGHLKQAHGPSECAVCRSVCIDGQETPGYIEHGREWTFQGNFLAGTYLVEAKHFDGNKKQVRAKVSAIMVKNVLHSIVTLKRQKSFITFDSTGWITARY